MHVSGLRIKWFNTQILVCVLQLAGPDPKWIFHLVPAVGFSTCPKLSSLREVAQGQAAVPGSSDGSCPFFWMSFVSPLQQAQPFSVSPGGTSPVLLLQAKFGMGEETQASPQPSSFTSVHLQSLEHSWKRQRLQELVCVLWDPARKATVGTARGGQGEEELHILGCGTREEVALHVPVTHCLHNPTRNRKELNP